MKPRATSPLRPGAVLLIKIADNVPPGVEQQGTRPAVVVAVPEDVGPLRFALLVVVPLTKATGDWTTRNPTLYPRLAAGQGGLPLASTALVDQVQAVDKTRVVKGYGYLNPDEFTPIRAGLEQMFGLSREGVL